MAGLDGLLFREWAIFKRKFWVITTAALVTPMLYLVAFGWGLGSSISVPGQGSYLHYILPGLAGMNVMLTSYGNTANEVGIARIFYGTFESYMIAPINALTYVTGKIVAGVAYGIHGCAALVGMMLIFADRVQITWYFVLVLVCTSMTFAALGSVAGLLLNSHQALSRFSTFVITPMSFLCGTFFPVDQMPPGIREVIGLLPLSHANSGLRIEVGAANGGAMALHIGVLLAYFVIFFLLAVRRCRVSE